MTEILFPDGSAPYVIALTLVVGVSLLELTLMMVGAGLIGLTADFDLDMDMDSDLVDKFATFVCLKKVPFLVWVLLFLTGFGMSGMTMLHLLHSTGLSEDSTLFVYGSKLIFPCALFVAFMGTSFLGGIVAKLMPKEHTSAVNTDSFQGMQATITLGVASKRMPAEAKFYDPYNQLHLVMVSPLNEDDIFKQGDVVVLVEQQGNLWLCQSREDLLNS